MRTISVAIVLIVLAAATSSCESGELELPAINAFSIGTDINIKSVKEIKVDSLNVILRAAQDRGEAWTKDFMQVALKLTGVRLSGSMQSVSVQIKPSEWEPGRRINFVRVTIENNGWLDDSVTGERFVVWLVQDAGGRLKLGRILWANLCHRPHWKYYSDKPCP